MSQRIVVTIPKAGLSTGAAQSKIEAFGFEGVSCRSVTESLQKLMGSQINETLTHEQVEDPIQSHITEGGMG